MDSKKVCNARDTLGGARAVAGRLPGSLGTELLGAARGAFGQAMAVTAAISAVLVLATAIGAAFLLRRVGAGAEPEPQPKEAGTTHLAVV
jgi:MFS transporter, DHA2 family, multidrug resistance protein